MQEQVPSRLIIILVSLLIYLCPVALVTGVLIDFASIGMPKNSVGQSVVVGTVGEPARI